MKNFFRFGQSVNLVTPNESELIRINPKNSVLFGLIRIERIHSDYKFGLILNGPRIDSERKISYDSINSVNPNESELIRTFNPNESEKLGFIRIERIHSDYKFGLILNGLWIDSE